MNKKIKFTLLIIFILSLTFISTAAFAAGWDLKIVPDACIGEQNTTANCGLTQMVEVMTNVAKIIFAVTGSLTLLMFTYGGAMFILAGGSQERISKAKQILTTAVIGLLIVLGAWLIVNFVVVALTGGDLSKPGQIFKTDWNTPKTN